MQRILAPMRSLSKVERLNALSPLLWIVSIALWGGVACDDEPASNSDGPRSSDMRMNDLEGMTSDDLDASPPLDSDDGVTSTIDASPLDDLSMDMEVPDISLTFDLGVEPSAYENASAPTDRLLAGYAERDLRFPLGSGVAGNGPGVSVITPYETTNPGTNTQHTALTAKALMLRQGAQTLTLIRLDTIGVWQTFLIDIQRDLRAQGRGDLADGLIIGATHTHASGARVADHTILQLLFTGTFSPAFYTRFRQSILDAIFEAEAALEPAQVGYDTIQVESLHQDRRCEDGLSQEDSMGLLKVTDDDGALKAIVVNYAMHGTVIGGDDGILSSDAPGAVEEGIERRLPTYAPVLYFQSWAGDMSPRTPISIAELEGDDLNTKYTKLDAIGQEAASRVIPALDAISTSSDPVLQVKTIRFPMSNDRVNPSGDFERYPYGGYACMSGEDNCGPDQTVYTPETLTCLPIPQHSTIGWCHITAGRIGDLGFVTLPGEPVTRVGVELRDRALEATGLSQMWVLGYSQGYLAYLLHPDDFYLGGYEGISVLLGPGFAQFLIDRGLEIATHMLDSTTPLSFRPLPLPDFTPVAEEELAYETALDEPNWTLEPTLDETRVWVAEWIGGDPAVDQPQVTLERLDAPNDTAEIWRPALHESGLIWSSNGPEIELSLRTEPSYEEALHLEARRFIWRARMPNRFRVATSGAGPLLGTYRWVIEGDRPTPYRLESDRFIIE